MSELQSVKALLSVGIGLSSVTFSFRSQFLEGKTKNFQEKLGDSLKLHQRNYLGQNDILEITP